MAASPMATTNNPLPMVGIFFWKAILYGFKFNYLRFLAFGVFSNVFA